MPIHPLHIGRIDPDVRSRMLFEQDYGRHFGIGDTQIEREVGGIASREQIFARADVIVLPKLTRRDVAAVRDGQVLWGWPHLVQDPVMTQLAIDKRLTMIAWESMNRRTARGEFIQHVFWGNNELAGYASVMHAMALRGRTGAYGRPLSAAVIGFGNSGRGAVAALRAFGVDEIAVLTHRRAAALAVPDARVHHFEGDERNPGRTRTDTEAGPIPTAAFLARRDIIVNCVLQDTDAPVIFATDQELAAFRPGSLLVDVSCDERMGFECARATTFDAPIIAVGNGVHYYGVDHSPAYFWDSATGEISEALLPYLGIVAAGPGAWEQDPVIGDAIEIRDGIVRNEKILSFQGRRAAYPYDPA